MAHPGIVTSLEPQFSRLSNGNELATSAQVRTKGVNTAEALSLGPSPGPQKPF